MKRAAIIQHAAFEGPGRLLEILQARGLQTAIHHVYAGDALPRDLATDDVLVVMGGAMSVTDHDTGELPFLAEEIELLKQRVQQRAPVLGICLGAQLLAFAAGSRVYPNLGVASKSGAPAQQVYEVGWAPVYFHAQAEPRLLRGLMGMETLLHWHGDTFDLPREARLFASTDACQNQAFSLYDRLFGLQFHCEVDAADIQLFLRSDPAYVLRACGPAGLERIDAETLRYLPRLREIGRRLLDNIVGVMLEPARE